MYCVIMPLLYQSRQHRRKERESLDCALALQELESLGVNNIITFDCHDPNVSNAIPNLPFENIFATETIIREIFKTEQIDKANMLSISPDMGAMERARYYAEILNCDVALFYKRRDLTKIININSAEFIYTNAIVSNSAITLVNPDLTFNNASNYSDTLLSATNLFMCSVIFLYLFFKSVLRLRR